MMDITSVDALAAPVIAARTLIALVLLVAAAGKLRDPATFRGAVAGYRLLPASLVGPVAVILPWIEVGLGVLMPTGLTPWMSGTACVVLFSVFGLAMAINMLRGRRDIDCGCFLGRPAQHLTWGHVARVAGLVLAAGLSLLDAPQTMGTVADGLVAGGVLFLLHSTASLLPTLERKRPRISL